MTMINATVSELQSLQGKTYETELTLLKNSILSTQANYVEL